jgi:SAM-dependent methyltransferase
VSAGSGYEEYALIADLYDHVGLYRDRPDVSFFVDAAREAGGAVLELGCGTGRVLIPTARAGIEIVGLDLSRHMLEVCRARLAAEPEPVRSRVTLVEADMRGFGLGREFTLATLPFRPFQHLLTVEDQLACLGAIRRHLAPGGRLILDLFNPSLDYLANARLGEEHGDEPEFRTPDGRRVYRRMRTTGCDRASQVNQHELIYYVTHADGSQERFVHAFPLRYLFRFEAEHLLARAGFDVEHVYGGYDKSPFGASYPGELILVARRRD